MSLLIHVNGPDGLTITSGYMEGSKFHNGQIVGPLETAPRETTPASAEDLLKSRQFEVTQGPVESSHSKIFTARFPTLDIPSKGPERPTQILVVLQLHLVASHPGVWDVDVSVRPKSRTDFEHDLPRARLAAVEQTWLPVVSGLNPKATYETSDLATLQPRGRSCCTNSRANKLPYSGTERSIILRSGRTWPSYETRDSRPRRMSIVSGSVATAPRRTDRGNQDPRRETHDRARLRRKVEEDSSRIRIST